MSSKLHGLVWEGCAFKGLIISEIAVMARLADYSNDEGISWPAVPTIQRQIGAKSENTVRSAIKKLQAKGWLIKQERKNGGKNNSNVYKLNIEKLEMAAAEAKAHYAALSPVSKFDASKFEGSEFEGSKSDGSNNGTATPQQMQDHPPFVEGDPSFDPPVDPSDIKSSCPAASQQDAEKPVEDFVTRHPEAVVYSVAKRQWGSQEDLTCAEWIWKKIRKLYEDAAEADGEVVLPKEPSWTVWANDVRLMCSQDQRTHRQICELFGRANRDPFWCKNILSPAKLREKWDDLSLKLSTSATSAPREDAAFKSSYSGVDYSAPAGFRS